MRKTQLFGTFKTAEQKQQRGKTFAVRHLRKCLAMELWIHPWAEGEPLCSFFAPGSSCSWWLLAPSISTRLATCVWQHAA